MAKTWVLVAESSRARLFAAEGRSGMEELETFSHPESRLHEQALTSDRPGRTFDSGERGYAHHSMEEDTEPKRYEAERFARQLADALENRRARGEFTNLILIAPPRFLGLLRDALTDETRKTVWEEVNKNLVQHELAEIRGHLPERLPA